MKVFRLKSQVLDWVWPSVEYVTVCGFWHELHLYIRILSRDLKEYGIWELSIFMESFSLGSGIILKLPRWFCGLPLVKIHRLSNNHLINTYWGFTVWHSSLVPRDKEKWGSLVITHESLCFEWKKQAYKHTNRCLSPCATSFKNINQVWETPVEKKGLFIYQIYPLLLKIVYLNILLILCFVISGWFF